MARRQTIVGAIPILGDAFDVLHKFGQAVQRTVEGRGRILLEKK